MVLEGRMGSALSLEGVEEGLGAETGMVYFLIWELVLVVCSICEGSFSPYTSHL